MLQFVNLMKELSCLFHLIHTWKEAWVFVRAIENYVIYRDSKIVSYMNLVQQDYKELNLPPWVLCMVIRYRMQCFQNVGRFKDIMLRLRHPYQFRLEKKWILKLLVIMGKLL